MIIIIDAYNLLRAVPPYKKVITDQERVQFISQLGSYGKRKGHKLVIVFDGGLHEWPFKENLKAVTVVYSGMHESADDYIKEYVTAHRAKDLLLVSSDAELNNFAARLKIPSIDSPSFNQLVYDELRGKEAVTHKKSDTVVKYSQDGEQTDIDELMLQASKSVPVKSEDVASTDNRAGTKKEHLGKDERALLKKLKKL